jgi:hypothetical protein
MRIARMTSTLKSRVAATYSQADLANLTNNAAPSESPICQTRPTTNGPPMASYIARESANSEGISFTIDQEAVIISTTLCE